MNRNSFSGGLIGDNAWNGIPTAQLFRGEAVGPLSFRLTKAQIEAGGYAALKRLPVPPGWTGSYPYIVKVNHEGEYIVYADGTAQWLDYINGHIGDPIRI